MARAAPSHVRGTPSTGLLNCERRSSPRRSGRTSVEAPSLTRRVAWRVFAERDDTFKPSPCASCSSLAHAKHCRLAPSFCCCIASASRHLTLSLPRTMYFVLLSPSICCRISPVSLGVSLFLLPSVHSPRIVCIIAPLANPTFFLVYLCVTVSRSTLSATS